MIKIIDCGSQLTQNIARRIRDLGVYAEIIPYHESPKEIFTKDLEGLIISGGQFSVYDKDAPLYAKEILATTIPVLGICYGLQSIAYLLGGTVIPSDKREYGKTSIKLEKENSLFKKIYDNNFNVWMSHGDIVQETPVDFTIIARSGNGYIAAMHKDNIYAVQFHPEVDHTEHGKQILDNFIEICHAQRTWTSEKQYDLINQDLKEKIQGKTGIGAVSGGVDSTIAALLANKITNTNYHPIFVDNGLLRLNETQEVQERYTKLGLNVSYINASHRFLEKLGSITDSDEKRKIIGHEFINVFEEEARKFKDASYLIQGTLYPDVIESIPVYGSSSKIKRHHNVGGLPEKLNLKIIEPFRYLFKDEVRKIAEHMFHLPRDIVWRHPFPGPGLAVRIIGEVTPEKLELLRKADTIFMQELKNKNLYYDMNQAFAVLLDSYSVGVMGDEGTYQGIIALRAVTTSDFMTADWYDFKKKDIMDIANRIINEVKGINRVVYDVSQKPPSTIEWE